MNKSTYVSPEVQLKSVTTEDILNTSAETGSLNQDLDLNGALLGGI